MRRRLASRSSNHVCARFYSTDCLCRPWQFTNLPTHWALRIELDFIKIDSWQNAQAQVFVDGSLTWESARFGRRGTSECGSRGSWHSDELVHVDALPSHAGETATVRVTSTISHSYGWWGMDNFKLTTVTPHPSPPAPPATPGQWSFLSRDYWPGRAEPNWEGVPNADVTTTCGGLGTSEFA